MSITAVNISLSTPVNNVANQQTTSVDQHAFIATLTATIIIIIRFMSRYVAHIKLERQTERN